jgi:hypothetical protein
MPNLGQQEVGRFFSIREVVRQGEPFARIEAGA